MEGGRAAELFVERGTYHLASINARLHLGEQVLHRERIRLAHLRKATVGEGLFGHLNTIDVALVDDEVHVRAMLCPMFELRVQVVY